MDRMGGGGAYRQVISRVTGGNYIGVGEVSQVGWWGTSRKAAVVYPGLAETNWDDHRSIRHVCTVIHGDPGRALGTAAVPLANRAGASVSG